MTIPIGYTNPIMMKVYFASDHISPATSGIIPIVISKNGGSFGNPSAGATNATEVGNGWYTYTPSSTDTGTAGDFVVRLSASGYDDSERILSIGTVVPTSGYAYLASGHFSFGSGQYYLAQGSINSGMYASGMIAATIPSAILGYDFSGIVNPAARSAVNALRKLRNKWDTGAVSGYLATYKEDDTTIAYTQPITAVSGAAPITEMG